VNVQPLVVSLDIEDWPQSTWDRSLPVTPRAGDNTARVLDLLAAHGRHATLFVLGKFAERFPALVRRMHEEGHEVASHGYGHVEIFKQSREEFRDDVSRAKTLVEEIIGAPVFGYRAPDFSVITSTLWALEVLAEAGFRYDSSIYPIAHSRYGIASWPSEPAEVDLPTGSSIVELPIATIEMFGRRWPVGGGGYHRLLPWPVIAWAIRRRMSGGAPFVAYCHPYEFDPGEFETLGHLRIPMKVRLHQGLGRGRLRRRFTRMIDSYETTFARDLAFGRVWQRIKV
jgi:polysaccharide deacetylase family protein (PEP-CTERM system associated)